ncbi:hypothetical protein, partial [Burkholderia sp. L27(2015)]|uniref:hypothetical protein n=1 Tax=Burkholderia sp. L27(2015) TaxID=1641858 RepID=UPI001C205307
SKRSIEKPQESGPAAYVFPADDKRTGSQAQLLRILQLQHSEISRTTAPITVTLPKTKGDEGKPGKPTSRTFAAGSYVVRMDQPYSRIADALLDRQYWSPKDPQQHPYDDTAWSMSDLFDVQVARVTDNAILKAPMTPVSEAVTVPQGLAALD